MDAFIGALAALGTAASFAFTSTFFTLAGRVLGSPLINRTRLLFAVLFTAVWHLLATGSLLPTDATAENVFWLALSGVVGLTLGDASLFEGFVRVGPRLSMLVMALAPVFATILAWLFLDETLTTQQLIGIVIAVAGIAWVVSERTVYRKKKNDTDADNPTPPDTRTYLLGLLFALGGSLGQAGGLVMSKQGLTNDFLPLSGNLIRLIAAAATIWLFTLFRGDAIAGFRRLRDNPRAFRQMLGGTIMGPVIGVWLSLVAVQRAPVGIASTLIGLTPIFLLPVSYVIFRERISLRAIVGTVMAMAGTALLFI